MAITTPQINTSLLGGAAAQNMTQNGLMGQPGMNASGGAFYNPLANFSPAPITSFYPNSFTPAQPPSSAAPAPATAAPTPTPAPGAAPALAPSQPDPYGLGLYAPSQNNGRAYGGPIVGQGGPRQDNIQTPTSAGEWVVQQPSVKVLGDRVMSRLNAIANASPAQQRIVKESLMAGLKKAGLLNF